MPVKTLILLGNPILKDGKMGGRKKIMNAREMEQWLLQKGAVPVSQEIKKQPWFREVSKLPSCLKPKSNAESGG